MEIYGRPVVEADALLGLVTALVRDDEAWTEQTFTDAAVRVGLSSVARRQDYFSFGGPSLMTGQAMVSSGLIDEVRLLIGNEPRKLSKELFEQDRGKARITAGPYVDALTESFGEARRVRSNSVFSSDGATVRVLATAFPIKVFVSRDEVRRELGHEIW